MTSRHLHLHRVGDEPPRRLPTTTVITSVVAIAIVWSFALLLGVWGWQAAVAGQAWPAGVCYAAAVILGAMGVAWWPRRDPTR